MQKNFYTRQPETQIPHQLPRQDTVSAELHNRRAPRHNARLDLHDTGEGVNTAAHQKL
ncbi:hypothetical protein [Rothia aeria]|uniref:hypothetical protein n=1 Tax=Rothia aeria TaxID=172042 RepID=UPI00241F650C|nr:hypothetical protein [Rothia aeria]